MINLEKVLVEVFSTFQVLLGVSCPLAFATELLLYFNL